MLCYIKDREINPIKVIIQTYLLNPNLLWEYDLEKIDYNAMCNVIVQRVIERVWPADWDDMLNLYGIEVVKALLKNCLF